ncbi:hypothetical protein AOX63_05865 [Pseudomonas sp. ADP]|nr:hypothetical protein AOX63_05865 [Pseudomonas sp. ADP]
MREINESRTNFNESLALKVRKELFEDIQEIKRKAAQRSAKQRGKKSCPSGKNKSLERPYVHSEEANFRPISVSLSIIETEKFETFNVEDIQHEES